MKKYIFFLGYVAASLLIGKEFQPFSTFPMYNSFPNWGYVFFLKNEKGEMLPYGKIFPNESQKNAGYVGHAFYSFMEHEHFPYGDGAEKPEHLHLAGEALMKMVLQQEQESAFSFDTLKVCRRYYFLVNEQLTNRDDCIYAQCVKK